jgi:hypothetical protein
MNSVELDHTRLPRPDHAEASLALAANCHSCGPAAVWALDLTEPPFLPSEAKYWRISLVGFNSTIMQAA